MADPVVSRIVDDIKTTLEGITEAAGYHRTIRAVSTRAKNLTDANRDLVYIATGRETKETLEPLRQVELTVALGVVIEDRTDPAKALFYIASDIEKALHTDVTRGGLAADTEIVSIEYYADEELDPQANCVIEVLIKFRHLLADPDTVA